MGRFRIQLLLEDNTWSTRYNIAKNDRYSDSSTDWTLFSLNFSEEKYGIKLIYDQIDTPHAALCFSIITIPHSVFFHQTYTHEYICVYTRDILTFKFVLILEI